MASDAPKLLNKLGQSLWLDNITRDLLDSGTLKRYIDELLGDRPDLQPDDLRQRDCPQFMVRHGNPPSARERCVRRGAVLQPRGSGPDPGSRPVRGDP